MRSAPTAEKGRLYDFGLLSNFFAGSAAAAFSDCRLDRCAETRSGSLSIA